MAEKRPFHQRIAIAFALMTLVVSGLFSLGMVGIVHFVEEKLVSQEMERELLGVLAQDIAHGKLPRLDHVTHFYASPPVGEGIPGRFDTPGTGFREVVDGKEAFYIYARQDGGQRYVLVQEQHDFEAREHTLFRTILIGFVLSVVCAWLLGLLMARRVMAPMTRLANQVRRHDQSPLPAPPLAPGYADDEIGRLAAAFDETLNRLRQALERERLFTSDVSHELRTPLMVIASSSELLETGQLTPRQREQVTRIRRAAEDMRNLVQTFLTLARGSQEATPHGGSLSLRAVADRQGRLWGPAMREKGLAFSIEVEAEDRGFYDPTLLGTVIANLLRNALHYTDEGEVRLVLETGGMRVEDTGQGIPPSQQARIFEPFVRGEQARGEGLGLGLSLVRRICAQQGWRIDVSQRQPRGSCFSVRFDTPPPLETATLHPYN